MRCQDTQGRRSVINFVGMSSDLFAVCLEQLGEERGGADHRSPTGGEYPAADGEDSAGPNMLEFAQNVWVSALSEESWTSSCQKAWFGY